MKAPVGLPGPVAEAIAGIREDHLNGAAILARKAAAVLRDLASLPDAGAQGFLELVAAAARAIVAAQPFMAPLVHLANGALWSLDRAKEFAPADALAAYLASWELRWREEQKGVAGQAAQLIQPGSVILTHSASSAVEAALAWAHAAGVRFSVVATESRPLLEGTALAQRLAGRGIPLRLIVDAAAGLLMREADCVLVGADSVSEEAVVNKAGTVLLALAARQDRVPFYAAAGSSKILPRGWKLPAERTKPASEIGEVLPLRGKPLNLYFDRTPLDLLSGIVSEDGLTAAAEVRLRADTPVHPLLAAGSRLRKLNRL
jgi:translation initiation factor eIF-2B subunit delta